MDTRTGKIADFEEHLKQGVPKKYLKDLTPAELEMLLHVDEKDRPVVLAVDRFIRERQKLGAPAGIEVRNAFRLGFMAGRESSQ